MLACQVLVNCGAVVDAAIVKEIPVPFRPFVDGLLLQAHQSMCRAAAIGSVNRINELASMGLSIDEVGPEGFTPVWLAVLHNHPLCFDVLIRFGANSSVTDHQVRQ